MTLPATPPRRRPVLRAVGACLLIVVLGLAFVGYLRPDMKVNWESVAAMCGF